MITNNKNSLGNKVVLGIKTIFDDLTNKIINKELKKFTVGSTSALFYVFKTDGSFDIVEFIPGENNTESFYDTYHNHFYNTEFDFSIKICDMLYLNNIQQVNQFYSSNFITKESVEDESDFLTRKTHGTIGVDFNKGFLVVSEIDKCGNLVGTDILKYRFGKGNKTQSDLENCISKILKRALETGKDICFEGLDFKNKKSKTMKGKTDKGKKYNNMLHNLAYSLYIKLITNIAFRNKVGTIKVNPAWTSWIAKNKFCERMKLNIHTGASFVIARRGLGIKDTVK